MNLWLYFCQWRQRRHLLLSVQHMKFEEVWKQRYQAARSWWRK